MQLFERPYLQAEVIRLSQVAPNAAPAEHGIVLVRLAFAALHGPELVCGRIQGAHPHRFGIEGIGHDLDALDQLVDVLLGLAVLDVPVGCLALAQDHVLYAQQPHTVSHCVGRGCGPIRLADIDLDLCSRNGFCKDHASPASCGRRLGRRCQGQATFVNNALAAIYCDLHAFFQDRCGFLSSHHSRTAQLAAHNGRVAGHASFVGDNSSGTPHARNHIRHGHLGDHDVSRLDLIQLPAAGNQSHDARGPTRCGSQAR